MGSSAAVKNCWNELLGDHFISVNDNTDANISNMIAQLAVKHYKKYYQTENKSAAPTTADANDSVKDSATTEPVDNYHPPMML